MENGNEDQLITISIFISTGRIMTKGKKFAEWSLDEFPMLLLIVNSLEPLGTLCSKDLSLFLTALPNFFSKMSLPATTQQLNDVTDKEDAVHNNEI